MTSVEKNLTSEQSSSTSHLLFQLTQLATRRLEEYLYAPRQKRVKLEIDDLIANLGSLDPLQEDPIFQSVVSGVETIADTIDEGQDREFSSFQKQFFHKQVILSLKSLNEMVLSVKKGSDSNFLKAKEQLIWQSYCLDLVQAISLLDQALNSISYYAEDPLAHEEIQSISDELLKDADFPDRTRQHVWVHSLMAALKGTETCWNSWTPNRQKEAVIYLKEMSTLLLELIDNAHLHQLDRFRHLFNYLRAMMTQFVH